MDLSKYDKLATTSGYLKVLDPVGEPMMAANSTVDKPIFVTIELLSLDSPQYDRVHKKMVGSQIKAMTDTQRGGAPAITGDQTEEQTLSMLVAATCGWVGFEDNGDVYEYTAKNARDMYKRLPFIREQVSKFVHTRGNFLPGS